MFAEFAQVLAVSLIDEFRGEQIGEDHPPLPLPRHLLDKVLHARWPLNYDQRGNASILLDKLLVQQERESGERAVQPLSRLVE